MSEFLFTGDLSLTGVTFYVEAETEAEAKQKAKAGEWSSYEIDAAAASTDWKLDVSSCEPNE